MTKAEFIQRACISMASKVIGTDGTTDNREWDNVLYEAETLASKVEEKGVRLPFIPSYATNNGHMYYLVCPSLDFRTQLMTRLKERGIQTTFHYLPLHSSEYYQERSDKERPLVNCDHYGDCLVRLPLYYELTDEEARMVGEMVLLSCGA